MSERKRTDLYYLMRADGPIAVYDDGRVGSLEEKYYAVEKDGKRKAVRRFAQIALFNSLPEYVVARRQAREEEQSKHHFGLDRGGSIDNVSHEVVESFREWESNLHIPTSDEIRETALQYEATEEERQTKIVCPCGDGPEQYYKYPLRRHFRDGQAIDEPFDLAGLLVERPDAVSMEVKTHFDIEGRMSAELLAKFNLGYVDSENGESIDEADALDRIIPIRLSQWTQAGVERWQSDGIGYASVSDLGAAIRWVQRHLATRLALEAPDNAINQEAYETLMNRLRELGNGALTLVREDKYGGMGTYWTELMLNKNPYEPKRLMRLAEGYYITNAIQAGIEKLGDEEYQAAAVRFAQKG